MMRKDEDRLWSGGREGRRVERMEGWEEGGCHPNITRPEDHKPGEEEVQREEGLIWVGGNRGRGAASYYPRSGQALTGGGGAAADGWSISF